MAESAEVVALTKKKTKKSKKKVVHEYTIYTDGSFRRPRYGAYAAVILVDDKHTSTLQGHVFDTTINRMEFTAVIEALASITEASTITIYSDSLLVVNSINKWLKFWRSNNWKGYGGQSIANQDLLERLWLLMQTHTVKAHWVKGHSGDKWNETCDKIAQDLTLKMLNGVIKE